MFTGIIEALGTVEAIVHEGSNIHFTISSSISDELKIDQSIAHNGVCLTVVELHPGRHVVTAIKETLGKSNFSSLKVSDKVNLERCLKVNDRLDGHMVQGHVDTTGTCIDKRDENGSWLFTFSHGTKPGFMTVEKGSICVNGTSLTVVNSQKDQFSVAIIPYTHEHTNFHQIEIGSTVNLEFDILGKYVTKLVAERKM